MNILGRIGVSTILQDFVVICGMQFNTVGKEAIVSYGNFASLTCIEHSPLLFVCKYKRTFAYFHFVFTDTDKNPETGKSAVISNNDGISGTMYFKPAMA